MARKQAVQKRPGRTPRPKTRASKTRASKKPATKKPAGKPSPDRLFAEKVVAILKDKLAGKPVIVDVRGLSNVTDFFVVASGNNLPHVRAMYEEVFHRLKEEGTSCYSKTDNFESGWLVLDYVNVVVHLMLDEMRKRYAIEDLWARAPHPAKATRRSKPRRPANPRG